mmetsp:Transcript_15633/g.31135  ORF Transcript_15633/g.31135 Transcript_15633/m.31135 type:complete len:207 (+) Transcript_15633:1354-1974(+)
MDQEIHSVNFTLLVKSNIVLNNLRLPPANQLQVHAAIVDDRHRSACLHSGDSCTSADLVRAADLASIPSPGALLLDNYLGVADSEELSDQGLGPAEVLGAAAHLDLAAFANPADGRLRLKVEVFLASCACHAAQSQGRVRESALDVSLMDGRYLVHPGNYPLELHGVDEVVDGGQLRLSAAATAAVVLHVDRGCYLRGVFLVLEQD